MKKIFNALSLTVVLAIAGFFGYIQLQTYIRSQACHANYLNENDLKTSKVAYTICQVHHICTIPDLVKLNQVMATSLMHLENKSQLDEIDRLSANDELAPQKPAPIIIRGEGGK